MVVCHSSSSCSLSRLALLSAAIDDSVVGARGPGAQGPRGPGAKGPRGQGAERPTSMMSDGLLQ